MLEDLADSRYLMTAYATASDSWEQFRATSDNGALFEVAAILCGAWTVLSEDDDFLANLHELGERRMAPDVKSAFDGEVVTTSDPGRTKLLEDVATYRSTERLLTQEMVVLVQAGLDPVHAVRLVTDLSEILSTDLRPLKHNVIATLEEQVSELAGELCGAQQLLKTLEYDAISELEDKRRPHRRWMATVRIARAALKATAGAAGAVGNVAAAVTSFGAVTGFGLVSVLAGAEVMATAVAEAVSPEPRSVRRQRPAVAVRARGRPQR